MKNFDNFNQYKELALKTEMPDYQPVCDRFTIDIARKTHGSFLLTEIIELEKAIANYDEDNIIEELGDCAWYIALLADCYNVDLSFDGKITNNQNLEEIKWEAFKIVDNLKKELFYNNKLNEEKCFEKPLKDLYFLFNQEFGDLFKIAMYKNIKKLQTRYSHRYNDKDANNRNIEAEMEAISQSR